MRDCLYAPLGIRAISKMVKSFGRKNFVVSFHNVLDYSFEPEAPVHNMDLAVSVFETQLEFLIKNYKIRPIAEVFSDDADTDGVFLSFDDGLANNFNVIKPILELHGLTAMFAVCPALINREIDFLWKDWLYLAFQSRALEKIDTEDDRIDFGRVCSHFYTVDDQYTRLRREYPASYNFTTGNWYAQSRFEPMNWGEVSELAKSGHLIASHTMTHRPLKQLTSEEIEVELSDSKREIEKQLGQPCRAVVLPYGNGTHVDRRAFEHGGNVGYERIFMNTPAKFNNPRVVPRFGLPATTDHKRLLSQTCGLRHLFRTQLAIT